MGTHDEVFDISHMRKFGKKLKRYGVQCKMVVAPGEGHAFDIWAIIGGKVHLQILRPSVDWIAQVVGLRSRTKRPIRIIARSDFCGRRVGGLLITAEVGGDFRLSHRHQTALRKGGGLTRRRELLTG